MLENTLKKDETMKKFIVSFVATLVFASATNTYAQSADTKKRQRVITAYVSSLILSGGVGAVTGGLVKYLEKKLEIEKCPLGLFLMLVGWALESELRNDIIVALQRDLDQQGIAHKKSLMFKGGWIASWLSYLHV
jgi:hypothetical protein